MVSKVIRKQDQWNKMYLLVIGQKIGQNSIRREVPKLHQFDRYTPNATGVMFCKDNFNVNVPHFIQYYEIFTILREVLLAAVMLYSVYSSWTLVSYKVATDPEY